MGQLPPIYTSSASKANSSSSFRYAFISPSLFGIEPDEDSETGAIATQNFTIRNGNQYTQELASYYDTIRRSARDTRENRMNNRSKTMVAILNREYLT